MRNETNPANCEDCARRTAAGYARGPNCRACCENVHTDEEACDTCPYERAGYEARDVMKLIRMCTSQHTDEKTKAKHVYIDTERVTFAFDLFGIKDKETAFRRLCLAVNVLNGDIEEPVLGERFGEPE